MSRARRSASNSEPVLTQQQLHASADAAISQFSTIQYQNFTLSVCFVRGLLSDEAYDQRVQRLTEFAGTLGPDFHAHQAIAPSHFASLPYHSSSSPSTSTSSSSHAAARDRDRPIASKPKPKRKAASTSTSTSQSSNKKAKTNSNSNSNSSQVEMKSKKNSKWAPEEIQCLKYEADKYPERKDWAAVQKEMKKNGFSREVDALKTAYNKYVKPLLASSNGVGIAARSVAGAGIAQIPLPPSRPPRPPPPRPTSSSSSTTSGVNALSSSSIPAVPTHTQSSNINLHSNRA